MKRLKLSSVEQFVALAKPVEDGNVTTAEWQALQARFETDKAVEEIIEVPSDKQVNLVALFSGNRYDAHMEEVFVLPEDCLTCFVHETILCTKLCKNYAELKCRGCKIVKDCILEPSDTCTAYDPAPVYEDDKLTLTPIGNQTKITFKKDSTGKIVQFKDYRYILLSQSTSTKQYSMAENGAQKMHAIRADPTAPWDIVEASNRGWYSTTITIVGLWDGCLKCN